jgi:DNA-binding LacI/PurR family transcriptional regulator
VGNLCNGFYPAVLEALSDRLQAMGYHVLLFTAPAQGDVDPGLHEVMRYQVDALVLLSATLSSRLAAECRASGIPVVLVNRVVMDDGVESVAGENRAGAARIARFLMAGGHRRFAYVAGLSDSSTNRDREAGFREELHAARLPDPIRLAGDYDAPRAGEAAEAMFARGGRVDAVFCASDHMALAVMDAARRRGLRVPEDVSVVGFDDAAPASLGAYDLTTYSQPVGAMVEEAARLLSTRLDTPAASPRRGGKAPLAEASRHVVVPGELIVRGSARRPPTGLVTVDGRTVWRDER